jgi:hypothetical protein
MVRKLPNFVSSLFEALMHFLLDIEDDPDWHRVRQACVCACCDHGLSGTAGGGRREAKQTQGQGGGGSSGNLLNPQYFLPLCQYNRGLQVSVAPYIWMHNYFPLTVVWVLLLVDI